MKIGDLRSEQVGGRVRVAATVTWEDCDRPVHEMYFETEEEFGQSLTCDPHAFLVGSILPAMCHGEKRVSIDGEICPELREGLMTAMTWVRHWYYHPDRELVRIEAKIQKGTSGLRMPVRTGFFFSGGIDSFGTFSGNRMNYPMEHPASIRDGLIIYGQNIESDNRSETFAKSRNDLSAVAREGGFTFIPVYTNVRMLDPDGKMFGINHGAILGAVAHAFSKRLTTMCISASSSIPGLFHVNDRTIEPHGSHPLIDPLFRSGDLRIRHDGITMSRLDKIKAIAGWKTALDNIKVCGPNWPGQNCGRCEKCVRTMLGLLAAGVLDKSAAFPLDDVSPEMVDRVNIKKLVFGYIVRADYLELISPLRQKGRSDLASAIERLVKRSYRPHRKSFLSRLREFDGRYLNGTLAKTKQLLYSTR